MVPEALQEHLEVLPEHGLMQASSCFAAQLKFHPHPGILTDCHQYCSATSSSSETVLMMPVEIIVTDLVCHVHILYMFNVMNNYNGSVFDSLILHIL